MIRRFIAEALGLGSETDVSQLDGCSSRTRRKRMGVEAHRLDHAIWKAQSRGGSEPFAG